MPLAHLVQDDFSAGMVRSTARQLIPESGLFDLSNGLLDDDGSVYKRGGSEYLSTAGFGTSGLRFLWDGQLAPGGRTVFANDVDFGALDAAEAPVNIGGAGLTIPKSAAALGGILFIGGGAMYGGSRKTANYTTGTVSVTNGSRTVTGSGTTWNTLVDSGMLFTTGGGGGRHWPVLSVDTPTQLTLLDPYEGTTGAGVAYTLAPLVTAAAPYRTADLYVVVGNRLVTLEGSRVYFSAGPSTTGAMRPHSFAATDFHEFPGATCLGGGAIRDRLVVFTTAGAYVVSNMALDLTDDFGNVQHRVDRLTDELILWSHEGIAQWRGSLVVPGTDGVWLVDGVSQPERLSRSITPLIVDYVKAGYRTGQATVFKSHYFLPILDSNSAVKDLLVCRLDRPTQTAQGLVFPWSRFADFGGNVPVLASRTGTVTRSPQLLAGSGAAAGRVLKLTKAFAPAADVKYDADGSAFTFKKITRDLSTGGREENLVRGMRCRYEMVDAASDNPTMTAAFSIGVIDSAGLAKWDVAQWDVGVWGSDDTGEFKVLAGTAPEDDGRRPFSWPHQVRTRYIRYRFISSSPVARLTVRNIDVAVRQSGRV